MTSPESPLATTHAFDVTAGTLIPIYCMFSKTKKTNFLRIILPFLIISFSNVVILEPPEGSSFSDDTEVFFVRDLGLLPIDLKEYK